VLRVNGRDKEGERPPWTIIIIIHAGVLQMLSFEGGGGGGRRGRAGAGDGREGGRWTKWVPGTAARWLARL